MPYLDANASEPLRPEARAALLAALDLGANPASVHAAGRAAHLQLVTRLDDVGQVGGHLAVVQPFDEQLDQRVAGRGGHRVRALGGVAVLGGQADVNVLAREVPRPVGDVQDQPVHPRGLRPVVQHPGLQPAQSPLYRCTRYGSP